jgi:hypothetical protein
MSYINHTFYLGDVARELSATPDKLAFLLNEIAEHFDGAPDDRFIEKLIADLDNATKGMIGIIAKAIEAESAVLAKPKAGPEKRASTADLDQADRFPRAVQSRRPVPPPEGDGT